MLLDDVDILLRSEDDKEKHTAVRSQATLLTVLDMLEKWDAQHRQVLTIGFSSSACRAFASRCDAVFQLDAPNDMQRRALIAQLLNITQMSAQSTGGDEMEALLSVAVEGTIGKSYAELGQLCRQAFETTVRSHEPFTSEPLGRLKALNTRLSTLIPASLKSGAIDDMMDVRVLSSVELLSSVTPECAMMHDDIHGQSAKEAWNVLVRSIVIPLCQSKELHELLDQTGRGNLKRTLCGGVLLTGPPMSGKSFLAYRCAQYAASLKPSIKLLDVSCTSLIHKEVGGSERAVRRLFDCARRAAPCILIMDAIENVAAVRGHDTTTEGTLDRVLSTLLVEMDGVDDNGVNANDTIAVIGVTHDSSLVDGAMLRPGRLGKTIALTRDWV